MKKALPCLLLIGVLTTVVLGEDCVMQTPFQLYPGAGILGQITMSQYRDGDKIPYEFHLDAVYHPWYLSAGIKYMNIPLHPDAQYAVDGEEFNLDWYGNKTLILGKVGVVFPLDDSELGLFFHGGSGIINVDWGQYSLTSDNFANDSLGSVSAFTFGFSTLARTNLGFGSKCTPINLWGEIGWYYSAFGNNEIYITKESQGIPAGELYPLAKEENTLFTLAAGIEVNFFIPCPGSSSSWGQ